MSPIIWRLGAISLFILGAWTARWGHWLDLWPVIVLVRLAFAARNSSIRAASWIAGWQLMAILWLICLPSFESVPAYWCLALLPPFMGWANDTSEHPVALIDAFSLGIWGYMITLHATPIWLVLLIPSLFGDRKPGRHLLWRVLAIVLLAMALWLPDLTWTLCLSLVAGVFWIQARITNASDPLFRLLDGLLGKYVAPIPSTLWRGGDVVIADGLVFLITEPFAKWFRRK